MNVAGFTKMFPALAVGVFMRCATVDMLARLWHLVVVMDAVVSVIAAIMVRGLLV